MILFSYFRSSAAYRLRIALNLKKIDHTITPVNLVKSEHQQAEYKALNPQGFVPALKLDDGRVITQSTAMLEYLETEFPEISLLPEDSFDKATVRSWVNTIACDIHPINNLRVLKYLSKEFEINDDQKDTWYRHWILQGFSALEAQLNQQPFCFSDEVSLADVYLIPQVYNALRFNADLSAYPKIMAIYEHCKQLPEFIAAKPENQSDAV